jgi:hypothetical protein
MKKLYFLFVCLSLSGLIQAQDSVVDDILATQKPKHENIAYTFKGTHVINGQSIEMIKKNALDFRVVHRFGNVADVNAGHTLAGFYAVSDVLFSFDYGIMDDLSVGLAFSKGSSAGPLQELYNVNLKYRVLKQTKDFHIPVSITLYGNAALSGAKNDPFTGNHWKYTTTDTLTHITTTHGSQAHRFSYLLQALIACKATDWLSLQVSPTFLWRNYVGPGSRTDMGHDKNGMFFLGLSARAKLTKRQAIVFEYFLPITRTSATYREYFPMLRGHTNAQYYPCLNIGYEVETGGHVFTINLTNTQALMENDFLPYTNATWAKGQFRLGFTISRVFQFGDKHVSPWTGKEPKPKKKKEDKVQP